MSFEQQLFSVFDEHVVSVDFSEVISVFKLSFDKISLAVRANATKNARANATKIDVCLFMM